MVEIFFTKTSLERKLLKIMKNVSYILVLDSQPESIFRWARCRFQNHYTLLYSRVGWFLLILTAHPSAIDCLLSLVHKASQDLNFEGKGQRSNFRVTGIWGRSVANNLRISQNFEKLKKQKSPFLSILDSPKYEFEITFLVLSQN